MSRSGYPRHGQEVMFIAHQTAPGQVFAARVARTEPLTLRLVGMHPSLGHGHQVSLVYRVEGMHHRLACEVKEWTVRGDTMSCELNVQLLENLERRRSERLQAQTPCSVSFVAGLGNGTELGIREGRVVDISLHGAMVALDYAPPVGSLCHLTIPSPNGPSIRALCVCTRVGEGDTLGLEFVDLIGDSTTALRKFLLQLRQPAA